jgi:lysophospholipase L1-like esterase
MNVPVLPDLNDPAVQANIRKINEAGKANSVAPGNFGLVGDATLTGVGGADDPAANLAEFKPQLDPVIQFFAAGIKGAKTPSDQAGFSSADILNPGKGTGKCQGKSPLDCALDAKPAIVIISVGRNDVAHKVPLDQYRNNLNAAVNAAAGRGAIPILVTITGAPNPADEPLLAQYNNVIYEVAKAANIPLFNLYAIRKDNPALVNPANGQLTSANGPLNLSPEGLQFGVNVAVLRTLQLLDSLKAAVPLG